MVRNHSILVVDDEPSVCFLLKEELSEHKKFSVSTANDGAEALNVLQQKPFDAVLLDVRMPRVSGMEVLRFIKEHHPTTQVIMLSNYADVKTAIEATKLGAYDFVSKPYNREELFATVHRAIEHRRLMIDNELMKYELSRKTGEKEIIARSAAMKSVLTTVKKVASSDTFIHIYGPSGSGKELIAHLVHSESQRRDHPFVVVNCAALPDTLLESELFGHEKGAFTNAYQMKQGLVEVANGGSLFLDEVGDISSSVQPKLLRFLETGEFRRVGGTNSMRVDVRVISATNKDIQAEVKSGKFREDLLYRLNVVTIKLPPLRERKEDIPLLVEYFLNQKIKSKAPKRINNDALQFLLSYDWPGNIRELEHAIEGAMLMSHEDEIEVNDFVLAQANVTNDSLPSKGTSIMTMEELEKIHIEHALKKFKYNRGKSAKALGITAKTLYLKIKRYKIPMPDES
ncbi:MAG: sigma-54-dependent Fis family transcriptional regulator [Ignavibacteriales bacterium]|nr:sigma-54-dependent Fis family transcriptional regulator [Ignavibacteriales bacterium]